MYEEQNIAKGLSWLAHQGRNPSTYNYWLKLHRELFGEVWTWAGKIRRHELNNPNFHPPHDIWPALYELERNLQAWSKHQTYPPREVAARFHERIETIHPFPNGNGRFGRILTEQICVHNTWDVPTWAQIHENAPDKRRQVYIEALIYAQHEKDYAPLIGVMYS